MNNQELRVSAIAILDFDPELIFGSDWDTDWRAAGALMEKLTPFHTPMLKELVMSGDIRDPRAIIEATVEALT